MVKRSAGRSNDEPPPKRRPPEGVSSHSSPPLVLQDMAIVQHEGALLLDEFSPEAPSVVHKLTLERVLLEAGRSWSLVFEEGMAAAVCDDLPPVVLEDRLRRVLYSSPVEGLMVRERGQSGDVWWSLSTKMKASDDLRISVYAGATGSAHIFRAFMMVWPRQMFRTFWCCIDLYELGRMTSYKRVPSKWVYTHHKGWQAQFAELGFSDAHFIHSTQARRGQEQEVDSGKCLSQPSLSTLGMIVVMARLVGCSAQSGGLRDAVARPAVAALLRGVLESCRRMRALTMSASICESWAPRWPCTEPQAICGASLVVSATLEVDLSPFVNLRDDPVVGHIAQRWVRKLSLDCRPGVVASMPLDSLLLKVVAVGGLVALAAQLFWHVAQWVELCVWQSLLRGQTERLSIKAYYMDAAAALGVPHRLDSLILRHVVASIEATRGQVHMSMTVDKANVGGIQLQVGVMVLGDNRSIMACPQVGVCVGGLVVPRAPCC